MYHLCYYRYNSHSERKYMENEVNYEPLARQIKRIWGLEKVVVVPVKLSVVLGKIGHLPGL